MFISIVGKCPYCSMKNVIAFAFNEDKSKLESAVVRCSDHVCDREYVADANIVITTRKIIDG